MAWHFGIAIGTTASSFISGREACLAVKQSHKDLYKAAETVTSVEIIVLTIWLILNYFTVLQLFCSLSIWTGCKFLEAWNYLTLLCIFLSYHLACGLHIILKCFASQQTGNDSHWYGQRDLRLHCRERKDIQLNRDIDTYIRVQTQLNMTFFLPVSPHRNGAIMSTLSTFNNRGDLRLLYYISAKYYSQRHTLYLLQDSQFLPNSWSTFPVVCWTTTDVTETPQMLQYKTEQHLSLQSYYSFFFNPIILNCGSHLCFCIALFPGAWTVVLISPRMSYPNMPA